MICAMIDISGRRKGASLKGGRLVCVLHGVDGVTAGVACVQDLGATCDVRAVCNSETPAGSQTLSMSMISEQGSESGIRNPESGICGERREKVVTVCNGDSDCDGWRVQGGGWKAAGGWVDGGRWKVGRQLSV